MIHFHIKNQKIIERLKSLYFQWQYGCIWENEQIEWNIFRGKWTLITYSSIFNFIWNILSFSIKLMEAIKLSTIIIMPKRSIGKANNTLIHPLKKFAYYVTKLELVMRTFLLLDTSLPCIFFMFCHRYKNMQGFIELLALIVY